jgi:hypothetical protein
VTVLGAPNWITPAAELEDAFFPTADGILAAVDEFLMPLAGLERQTEARDARTDAWRSGV